MKYLYSSWNSILVILLVSFQVGCLGMARNGIPGSRDLTRGISKKDVELSQGKPEQIINKNSEHEIWYYYLPGEKVKSEEYWGLLYPLTWPWIIFHPFSFWDIQKRTEIYFNGDIVVDIMSYRAIDNP
jgi:hypothetical protein